MSDNETQTDNRQQITIPCLIESTYHDLRSPRDLPNVLREIFGKAKIAGIMWATNGTRVVHKLPKATESDLTHVFEARIWRVIEDKEENVVLAQELRWLNGMDATELKLQKQVGDKHSRGSSLLHSGWARNLSYLTHKDGGANDRMTAVELIQQEEQYGNTIVVDQLFTGEWAE